MVEIGLEASFFWRRWLTACLDIKLMLNCFVGFHGERQFLLSWADRSALWWFSILQLTAVAQTPTPRVLQSTLHGGKLLTQLLPLETDKILMIASLFRVIMVAVTMEITMISKLSLLLVSQKAMPDLTVHMELPASNDEYGFCSSASPAWSTENRSA